MLVEQQELKNEAPQAAGANQAFSDAKLDVGLVAWLRTCAFMLSFGATLLIFDLVQRIALLISRRAHERVVVALNKQLLSSLALTGAKFEFPAQLGLPLDRPILIISNHQSMFDIPILHTIFAAHFPRFISKVELARWIPSVSYNLRKGLNACIDRSNPRQAVLEIQKLAERMNERRFATVIFPEGTRARDGKLKKFRTAGLAALLKKVPDLLVVPVALDGSWLITIKKLLPVPTGLKIRVAIGPQIETRGKQIEQCAEEAEQFVANQLNTWRQLS